MGKRGWLNLTFGEICLSLLTGGTPDTSIAKYWSGSVPWITGADFLNQKIAEPRRYITEEAVHRSNTRIIKAGNLLVVTRTGVGKIAIAPFDIAVSQDTTGVYFHENISVDFMFYCIQSQIEELKKLNQGTSINGILKADLLALALTIPESFAEQQKIAEILSTIDRAIEQTEAIIAKQQRIKTGLMQDLLTKGIDEDGNVRSDATHKFKDSPLGQIPTAWEAKTIGGILNEYGGKLQTGPFGSQLHASEYVAEGIPFVMPQDIQNSGISEVNIARITEERANDLARHRMLPGDIVFARRGDLSRCAVVKEYQKGWVCGSGCFLMKPPKESISPRWITEVYRYYTTQLQVNVQAVGSTMVNLNKGILASLYIPFPTHREQVQIEERLNDMEKDQIKLWQQLDKLKCSKIGLMQDLLTGNVRVTALLND